MGETLRERGTPAVARARSRTADRLRRPGTRRGVVDFDAEHYLPLLYVIAQQREDETITFAVEGVDGGSIYMLTVQVG
jgi:aromatic ring-opening dioxygenase catalytic subunit (LigB family)